MGGHCAVFRQAFLYLLISVVIFSSGCGQINHVDKEPVDNSDRQSNKVENQPVDNTDKQTHKNDYEQLIEPNNTLGFALIDKIDPDENQNIFISPTSALMALLMTYNGAEGETKEEIADALSIHGLTVDEANDANATLMNMLQNESEAIQLSIANSIWLNENFHFTDEFTEKTMNNFQAEISEINVMHNDSVDKINNWVRESTNHKIDKIIEAPLDSDMVALLINALYFNGKWTHEFNEGNTEELSFYTPQEEKKIPFMALGEEL